MRREKNHQVLRGTAGQITGFLEKFKKLIRRGAPFGTAKGCGEDSRQKILDCGGVYRIGGMGASAPISDQL